MNDAHLLTTIGALTGAVALLWRLDRARLVQDLDAARAEASEWQSKWSGEVKARAQDSDLFLRALRRKHAGSSDPPTSDPPTSGA
jgi:hypothetical protein